MSSITNKNAVEMKFKVLQRVFIIHGKVYELHTIIKQPELVGFDNLGNKMFQPKKKQQVFYGTTKFECNQQLKNYCSSNFSYVYQRRTSYASY